MPRIVDSPAFRDGMLVVTFDEAESDSSALLQRAERAEHAQRRRPEPGPGGGRIGAVVLSPYTRAGTTSPQQYNHYSFLRSVEDLFGLDAPRLRRPGRPGAVRRRHLLQPRGHDDAGGDAGRRPSCRTASLAGKPRRLAPHTLLASLRLRRASGRRVLTLRTTHYARVTVRGTGSRLVQPCRSTRITLARGSRGKLRVTASTATHAERRTVG